MGVSKIKKTIRRYLDLKKMYILLMVLVYEVKKNNEQ